MRGETTPPVYETSHVNQGDALTESSYPTEHPRSERRCLARSSGLSLCLSDAIGLLPEHCTHKPTPNRQALGSLALDRQGGIR
jgi:hypothetical protein